MLHYESVFDENKWALDPRQILFVEPGGCLIINKKMVDNINECSVSHEIWLTDECLALYFNHWTHGVSAVWLDTHGPHYYKRVAWHWVEQLHNPENDRRAMSLDIEGYRKFIWVFHLHDSEDWYDRRLNIRKGVWPD